MAQQREVQKQICIGALGVSAVLGLPQLFAQPAGAPSRAGPSALGAATRAPEVQHQAAGTAGTAPIIGFGLVGATALVARTARGSRSSRTTPAPLRAFENELGVQSPFGFWDPAGFTSDGDVEAFKRRRVTEIKHGRISMLATLGYMVPEGFRFDGYLSPSEGIQFSDVPHGLAAISKVPAAGWAQILFFAGFVEKVYFKADPKRAPGDYENAGVLGFPDGSTIADPVEKKRRLNAELANGRLAMTAILALFFQNGTLGTTGPEMWMGSR